MKIGEVFLIKPPLVFKISTLYVFHKVEFDLTPFRNTLVLHYTLFDSDFQ